MVDNMHHCLTNYLRFSIVDWRENIRCVANVVVLFANVRFIIIVKFIYQYKRNRAFAKPYWTQQVCGGVHESVFACVAKVGIVKVYIIYQEWEC